MEDKAANVRNSSQFKQNIELHIKELASKYNILYEEAKALLYHFLQSSDTVEPNVIGKSVVKFLKEKHNINPDVALEGIEHIADESTLSPLNKGGIKGGILNKGGIKGGIEERYLIKKELGRGGMGTVFEAYDLDLHRVIALKKVALPSIRIGDHPLPEQKDSKGKIERFIEEAQVTSQLEHPNIVPVHDLEIDKDGFVYYTMKKITGVSLKDRIQKYRDEQEEREKKLREQAGIYDPKLETVELVNRHRKLLAETEFQEKEKKRSQVFELVSIFNQVCKAISFAHSRGAIHRDLKPDNIMIGSYGEVYVVDWGLVKIRQGGKEKGTEGDKEITNDLMTNDKSLMTTDKGMTIDGTVMGTPAYMPPEQAEGKITEIDERSDIYSLGAILYEILTYSPPFTGNNFNDILDAVIYDTPRPPSKKAKNNYIPQELESICMKCLEKEKRKRYQSVEELSKEITEFLEGSKTAEYNHNKAEELSDEANRIYKNYKELKEKLAKLKSEIRNRQSEIKPYDPIEIKEPLWELEDKAKDLEMELVHALTNIRFRYAEALGYERENKSARSGLAELYLNLMLEAEEQGDITGVGYNEFFVRMYDDGKYDSILKGDGTLQIETNPTNAKIYLFKFEEIKKILIPIPYNLEKEKLDSFYKEFNFYKLIDNTPGISRKEGFLTQVLNYWLSESPLTPLNKGGIKGGIPIKMGSYLAIIRKEGYRDVRLPIFIGRNQDVSLKVNLYTDEQIGDDFVYIPGGSFIMGGDKEAAFVDPEKKIVELPDYFVKKYPITQKEYCDYLNELEKEKGHEFADKQCPKWNDQYYCFLYKDAHFEIDYEKVIEGEARKLFDDIQKASDESPIFGVNWYQAMDYCKWLAEKAGKKYQLISEAEYEKCARGADGRIYPWGNEFDPTFCKMYESRSVNAQPEPLGTFTIDESVYGVRDIGGSGGSWTSTKTGHNDIYRVLKGGSWGARQTFCRCASRYLVDSDADYLDNLSVRVVCVP